MDELSERQQSILNFIMKEIREKGYPPSVREIGKAVGLKSPASVHNHLKTLERMNYIRRDPSKPRAIEVLYDGLDGIEKKPDKELLNIPLVGEITAGEPVLADENIEDYFPVPIDYIKTGGKDVFMLRVKGDSMINAGIFDGDYVIAQQQNVARNGDIVIALIEEEATVKTFYKEDDHIRLQPENPAYEPIVVPEIMVLGKVVGLYRSLG